MMNLYQPPRNRSMRISNQICKPALCIVLGVGASLAVSVESVAAGQPTLAKYQEECGACHLAYPPDLLPAASWKRVMLGLRAHYGVDASLESASLREISDWLNVRASTHRRTTEQPPQDRITKSGWFLRQHNAREVQPATWTLASVGSPSNCAACHRNAAKGSFSERDIKVPR